ncbi:MAG: hypothetical protein U0350_36290 [Caldilineaceae bacterium]
MAECFFVLIGVYVGVSIVSHAVQFLLWQRVGERVAALETQVAAGFAYANMHTDRSVAALRNGSNGHG